ncbi:hypothetical protein ACTGWQ_11250 [Streptococcus suis]
MSIELKDLVSIDFEKINTNAMLTQEFRPYNKFGTKEVEGYVGEFIITEGEAKGFKFEVKTSKDPRLELFSNYTIEFDKVNSFVYANKNKFGLQAVFKATDFMLEP